MTCFVFSISLFQYHHFDQILVWFKINIPSYYDISIDYAGIILSVPCLKAPLSKGLGLGIIAGSILVKVPQIVKILKNKSAEGLSFTGTSLELVAVINSFCYNFVKQYPFRWVPISFEFDLIMMITYRDNLFNKI